MGSGTYPAAAGHADGISIGEGASLYYGVPALAFVLAATDRAELASARAVAADATTALTRRRLHAAHRRIDQGQRPPYAEYDLIRGLTGLGVALRRLGDQDTLDDVLTYLVRLTEPIGDLPGWWCPHGPNLTQPGPPGGHSNHGIAHGISGPLALLALTLRDGTTVHDHRQAILRICEWLDHWQQHSSGGAWWPQTLTAHDVLTGRPSQPGPLRPSLCYSTPGIARAYQLAGLALDDDRRQHQAEATFLACINDAAQLNRLTERGLCHGTAGLLATARRVAVDATTISIPVEHLQRRHRDTASTQPEPAGFLNGAAGAALADTATTATNWDACLLLA